MSRRIVLKDNLLSVEVNALGSTKAIVLRFTAGWIMAGYTLTAASLPVCETQTLGLRGGNDYRWLGVFFREPR